MKSAFVDSNVILDIFQGDPHWADWSEDVLSRYCVDHTLLINPVIYSEISIGFERHRGVGKRNSGVWFQNGSNSERSPLFSRQSISEIQEAEGKQAVPTA